MTSGDEREALAVLAPCHGRVIEVAGGDLDRVGGRLSERVDDEHVRSPVGIEPEIVLAVLQRRDPPRRFPVWPATLGVAALVGNARDVGDPAGVRAPHRGTCAERVLGHAPGLAARGRHDIELRLGSRPLRACRPQECQPCPVGGVGGRGVAPARGERPRRCGSVGRDDPQMPAVIIGLQIRPGHPDDSEPAIRGNGWPGQGVKVRDIHRLHGRNITR